MDLHQVFHPFEAFMASEITNWSNISPMVTSPPPIQSTRLSSVWTPSRGTKKNAAAAMANVNEARVHKQAFHVCLGSSA